MTKPHAYRNLGNETAEKLDAIVAVKNVFSVTKFFGMVPEMTIFL